MTGWREGCWIDGGLGDNYRVIYQRCAKLQSRSVFGRRLVVSPDPRLMESLREADPDTYGTRGAATTARATTGDRAMKKHEIERSRPDPQGGSLGRCVTI